MFFIPLYTPLTTILWSIIAHACCFDLWSVMSTSHSWGHVFQFIVYFKLFHVLCMFMWLTHVLSLFQVLSLPITSHLCNYLLLPPTPASNCLPSPRIYFLDSSFSSPDLRVPYCKTFQHSFWSPHVIFMIWTWTVFFTLPLWFTAPLRCCQCLSLLGKGWNNVSYLETVCGIHRYVTLSKFSYKP